MSVWGVFVSVYLYVATSLCGNSSLHACCVGIDVMKPGSLMQNAYFFSRAYGTCVYIYI